MFDLLIKNAIIVDGTGLMPYIGHIAIKDGIIAKICRLNENDYYNCKGKKCEKRVKEAKAEVLIEGAEIQASKVLDACGKYVTPGFIDIPRYGTLRGTSGRRFMGEVSGSDKHFSFSIPARNECKKLHLFESAIDLLSYCTLELLSCRDWRKDNYLSLAGVYMPKKIIEENTLPAALIQYLKDSPKINEIALHLDNDTAGRLAAKTIQTILSSAYIVSDEPPKHGKDYNDYLKIQQRNILER